MQATSMLNMSLGGLKLEFTLGRWPSRKQKPAVKVVVSKTSAKYDLLTDSAMYCLIRKRIVVNKYVP